MRYHPDRPFPPYAYVPGRHPHPVTDPRGHSYGVISTEVPPLNPARPEQSDEFLYAIDLFNHGYYWEAHEAWEGLWHAAGRTGPVADLLKALIKLAAAGVKAREGNAAGVRRHALRAAELLRASAANSESNVLFRVLQGQELIARADQLALHPVIDATLRSEGSAVLGVEIILDEGHQL